MTNRNRRWSSPRKLAGVVTCVVIWSSWPGVLGGQTELTLDQVALRDAVAARYDVVLLLAGLGLTPRDTNSEIRMLELRDGTIAIDGTPVSGQELRERVGEDANLILRLSYLDRATRLGMFGADSQATSSEAVEQPTLPEPAVELPPAQPSPVPRAPRTTRSDVVRFGGNVTVASDERVSGDVVVIGGSLTVDGEVTGDVVVVGGPARFGPEALVAGEVTVVGGPFDRAGTAEILGGINQVGFQDLDFGTWGGWFGPRGFQGWALAGTLLRLIFLAVVGCLVVFVAQGTVERVALRSVAEPLKAGLVGLLVQILFVPLFLLTILLLVISIIGIPLLALMPFVLIAMFLAMIVGFTGVVQGLGRWLGSAVGRQDQPVYLSVWIGVALILMPTMAAEALSLTGGVFGRVRNHANADWSAG